MNRSILIVICDFLLVSLLAFSTVDINKVADPGTVGALKMDIATNQVVESGKDLAAVMRLALDEERKSRDQILSELNKSRAELTDREKQSQSTQQELLAREQAAQQAAQRLERDQAGLREQQSKLQQQYADAQTNLLALNQKLQSSSVEAAQSKAKLSTSEEELRKREEELRKRMEQAAALQQQLDAMARSNQSVLNEKQLLAGKLQLAETEKRFATEQAARMQEEVKIEREEKAKLAEGVKVLASRSGELAKEVRENRPLAPNAIFSEFLTNRVDARFNAVRSRLLGPDANKSSETHTVLVSDGTNTYALCHIQDTPLTLWNPGTDWDGLDGTLSRSRATFPIHSLYFHLRDPRVVWVPLSGAEARDLGGKAYRISVDPYKFQDAVLVGAREGYYGECRFEIDPSTPDYVRLDRSVLKGLFGKFNPSRGDLVFSRTGEMLGIMVNSSYCLMMPRFDASAVMQFGQDVRGQQTGSMLASLYSMVMGMPLKLQ